MRERFITILMTMKSSASLPHLIMFIYTSLCFESIEMFFRGSPLTDLYAIQNDLGVAQYFLPNKDQPKAPDIKDMPLTLTALGSVATNVEMANKAIAKHIALLNELLNEFDTLDPRGTTMKLRSRIDLLLLRNQELDLTLQDMRQQVQSMVQMVIIFPQAHSSNTG
jgi:hypothetical protein